MSLDKAIESGKEHRKPYRKSKAFDTSCRVHGGGHAHPCPWCERNRRIRDLKNQEAITEQLSELKKVIEK